jgi:hypothetical protein
VEDVQLEEVLQLQRLFGRRHRQRSVVCPVEQMVDVVNQQEGRCRWSMSERVAVLDPEKLEVE